jgi:hypothetical protein
MAMRWGGAGQAGVSATAAAHMAADSILFHSSKTGCIHQPAPEGISMVSAASAVPDCRSWCGGCQLEHPTLRPAPSPEYIARLDLPLCVEDQP